MALKAVCLFVRQLVEVVKANRKQKQKWCYSAWGKFWKYNSFFQIWLKLKIPA